MDHSDKFTCEVRKMIVRSIYMISIILSIIVWPISAIAMEKEPDNFRGIRWGTDIGSLPDMEIVNESNIEKMCVRKNERMTIGKAVLGSIRYFFYKGKFYSVYISFEGRENFNYLKELLFALYGKPEKSRLVHTYYWFGKKVDISFRYNDMLGIGSLLYSYLPLNDQLQEELKE